MNDYRAAFDAEGSPNSLKLPLESYRTDESAAASALALLGWQGNRRVSGNRNGP